MAKGRMFSGNQPPSNYEMVDEFNIGVKQNWVVFKRVSPEDLGSDYVNLKVYVKGSIRGKANYWIAWCISGEKFTKNRDLMLMNQKQPELLAMLFDYFEENYAPEDEDED